MFLRRGDTHIFDFLRNQHLNGSSNLNHLLIDASKLLSSNILSVGLGFVQGIIIARALGVGEYGLFGLITTFTSTVNSAVDSRIWETAIKFVTHFRQQGDTQKASAVVKFCYCIDFGTGTLAFLAVLWSADLAASMLAKDHSAASLIRLYALSILIGVPVGTSMALLRIGGRFTSLAVQNSVNSAIRLCGIIVIVLFGNTSVGSVLVVYLLAALVNTASLFLMAQRYARTSGYSHWYKASLLQLRGHYKSIISFTLLTNFNGLLKLVQNDLDTLVVGFFFSTVEVGYLRVTKSFTNLMAFVMTPLYGTVAYPEFVRLYYEQSDRIRRLFRDLSALATLASLLSLAVVWLGGETLIYVTFGAEYVPAYSLLKGYSIGTAIAISACFFRPLLLAAGYTRQLVTGFTISTALQILCLFVLLPLAGIQSIAAANITFQLAYVVALIPYVKQALTFFPAAASTY